MIVTVTPTLQAGTVVRWYDTENAEDRGEPIVTASRNGVRVHGYLHDTPVAVLATAHSAWHVLRADNDADLNHLATHRRRGILGPLVPVERPFAGGGVVQPGPDTGSDTIPLALSPGGVGQPLADTSYNLEADGHLIAAADVASYGRDLIDQINQTRPAP